MSYRESIAGDLLKGFSDLLGRRSALAAVILVAAGGLSLGYGTWTISAAHPADPVRVTGTVATYFKDACNANGGDCKLFVRLADDPDPQHRYEINAVGGGGQVVPGPDEGVIKPGMAIALWYDRGTNDLLGMSLGETAFARPQFVGDWYLHPRKEYEWHRSVGLIFAGIGTLLIALAGLYEFFMVLPAHRAARGRRVRSTSQS